MTARVRALIDELTPLLGEAGVLTGDAVSERRAGIWRDDTIAAPVIFRPASTAELASVLRACHQAGQPVVTHGGLTGLVEGAIAKPAEVVLSTERLNQIEEVNAADRLMIAQAGVRLQTAQAAAEAADLILPLDLGARGSCTLGGNAATHAGGNKVIRYGMTRELVLGLEAVLADGTVVSSLNGMLKNNAGYDLKQLFIGTEGTLGVITRLVLRLKSAPRSQETALLACHDFAAVSAALNHFDANLGGTLSAFEVMWQNFYALVAADAAPAPLSPEFPFYVLLEAQGGEPESDRVRFEQAVVAALETGVVADAVVCKSIAEREALWQLRDSVEKTLEQGPALIFDVSVRLSVMESYVNEVLAGLDASVPGHRTWVFGHAGDGNLHLVCGLEPGQVMTAELRHAIETSVYAPLQSRGGSISGEHGIGLEKKPWLGMSRSAAEIALMRRLKQTLDPQGILNPGRVFDTGAA